MTDFRTELPSADVALGSKQHIRIYGFSDITPPLVEVRLSCGNLDGVLNLTVDQAVELAAGLERAASRARGAP
jgi:hypothetical protein